MKKRYNQHHRFLKDTNAVSEEFTALPALAVVMIGLTLFILLITNVYQAYEARIDSIKKYQTADFIATKITNTESPYMLDKTTIEITSYITNGTDFINTLNNEYQQSDIHFCVRLQWTTTDPNIPSPPQDIPTSPPENSGNQIAVSRYINVRLSTVQLIPAQIIIITWST